ncbi:MAG: hypothetical protein ACI97A_002854 [Planctomycetota bacterium]|jgi:hypothetical protein
MAILAVFCFTSILGFGQRLPAPGPADYVDMSKRVGSEVKWFVNEPTLLLEGRNRAAVTKSKKENKDFDRSAALEKALTAGQEQNRLILYYVPRILAGAKGRQAYRPAILDHYMMSVHFSDPDCVELINRMFIPVRLTCDAKIGAKLGIKAPELLEPAIFILSPDGAIVRAVDRFRSFNSAWFDSLLLEVLAKNGPFSRPTGSTLKAAANRKESKQSAFDYAIEAMKDGDLVNSGSILGTLLQDTSLDPALKKHVIIGQAKNFRRLTASLSAANFLTEIKAQVPELMPLGNSRKPTPIADEFYCELGRNRLLARDTKAAAEAFAKVRSGPKRAEAQYHLGICDFFDGREDSALRRWKDAAAADRDNPYAWRAAANLIDGEDRTPIGAMAHGFEDPFGQPAPKASATTTSVPQSLEMSGKIGKDAVDFLLRMQRSNGSWPDSRYAYWGAPDYTPNVWIATTALACTALLEWRHVNPEAIDRALKRGEAYMFDRRRMAFNLNEEVYAHTYRLVYLSKKIDATNDEESKRVSIDQMNMVIGDLANIQVRAEGRRAAADGAFSHEYPNAFTTAAALNSLHLAKEKGATVPRKMFIGGSKALLAARDKDGAYAYSNGRKVNTSPETLQERLKNSMGRSPVAEAALLWSKNKKGSTENLKTAMDNFWKFLPRLKKVRKCDFHTDGELAGFFFWHVMFHTTEAINALPQNEQAEHRRKLHQLLVELAEIDGSFIDSHEIGKSYGTAMGLISLKAVMPAKPE